uniref:Uncharacterized protein n=1 Tax=Oryza rufipogon TaxID=4529 RepID=A0A0E0PS24_ORYRU
MAPMGVAHLDPHSMEAIDSSSSVRLTVDDSNGGCVEVVIKEDEDDTVEHDDGFKRRAVCGGSSSAAGGGGWKVWRGEEQHDLWQIKDRRRGATSISTGIVVRPPSPEVKHALHLDTTLTHNTERRHTLINLNLMSSNLRAADDEFLMQGQQERIV